MEKKVVTFKPQLCNICNINYGNYYNKKCNNCLHLKNCINCNTVKEIKDFANNKKNTCLECNKLTCNICKKTFINTGNKIRSIKIKCDDCKINDSRRCLFCDYFGNKNEFKNNYCKSCFQSNKYIRSKLNESKNKIKKDITKAIENNDEEKIRSIKINIFEQLFNIIEIFEIMQMSNEQINEFFEYTINRYSDNKSDINDIDLDKISIYTRDCENLSLKTKDLDDLSLSNFSINTRDIDEISISSTIFYSDLIDKTE